MPPTEREKRLHMLLSDDEDRMIRAIADADGLSVSDAIRQMIRRTFMERWLTKVKTKR
jgi:transcriptional regulator CtsR